MEQAATPGGPSPASRATDYAIGAIGAGFIMRDVQLVAYRKAGFRVAAIASRSEEGAREVAARHAIPKVYATPAELIEDPAVEVLDIAVPPHVQPGLVEQAVSRRPDLRGILAQKPLALDLPAARRVVELCERAGIPLAVNQNMRYDQSIRALKTLLAAGDLGEPVLATIEMRAIPHWQTWLRQYGRLTLLNMSIHHLDCFRYLFGDPRSVYASVRRDPRTAFEHRDGIALYILEYAGGLRASAWDDVWSGPCREGAAPDIYIKLARRRNRRAGGGHHRLAGLSQCRAEHDSLCHPPAAGLLGAAAAMGKGVVPGCVFRSHGRTDRQHYGRPRAVHRGTG